MSEIWKDVVGYEGLYKVSDNGNVMSLHYNHKNEPHLLKQSCGSSGYLHLQIYKGKKCKTVYVHQLVAEAFIPNPHNKQEINHINGNKLDNRLSNLEWATTSENQKHAIRNGLRKPSPNSGRFGKNNPLSKTFCQYDLNGNFIREWTGITQTAKEFGVSNTSLRHCLNGKHKTCCGFIWKYKEG